MLLAAAVLFAACEEPPTPSDAASRADAAILETGLAYADAPPPVSDASTNLDASARDTLSARCPGACDPTAAGGCADGEQCVVDGEAARCGVGGDAERYAPCSRTDACGPGLACFLSAVGGVCDRVCCPSGGGCDGEETCGGDGLLIDGARTAWGQCAPPRACRLLEARACPDREACYLMDAAGESRCLRVGDGVAGSPCTRPNDCAANLVCVGAVERVCTPLCALGEPDACASGASCVRQAYTPDGVGICVAAGARP